MSVRALQELRSRCVRLSTVLNSVTPSWARPVSESLKIINKVNYRYKQNIGIFHDTLKINHHQIYNLPAAREV